MDDVMDDLDARLATGDAEVALNPVNPAPGKTEARVLIGTPTLGVIRIEWYNAMNGMVTPPNWAVVRSTPTGYTVGDAQNMLVDSCLRGGFTALMLIEDDTCPPANAMIEFDRWLWKMERRKAPPVVSGIYHIKGSGEVRRGKSGGIELMGPEPLAYRGSGQRAFRDFKYGDVIWVSGVPTGALLIHRSVLEAWANEPDIDVYGLPGYPYPVKRVFQNPSQVWVDDAGGVHVSAGTTDLWWSDQTIKRNILAKAGWPEIAKRKYPFVIDTALRFGHVDRATGQIY